MGLKIGPVCLVLALSGLAGPTSRGPTGPSAWGFIRPQTRLCGLAELGLAGREKDLSPGMQVFWVHGRSFSTKIRAFRPNKGLNFRLGEVRENRCQPFLQNDSSKTELPICKLKISAP